MLDDEQHDRESFSCGKAPLDSYLRDDAIPCHLNDANRTYVATAPPDNMVLGFFSISAISVKRSKLSAATQGHVSRFSHVPAILLGQLAVRKSDQRRGMGGNLLMHAFRLAEEVSRDIGVALVIVDAIDAETVKYYEDRGFCLLPKRDRRLFISMKDIRAILPEDRGRVRG